MKHSMKGLSAWLRVAPEGSSIIFPRNESRTITDLAHSAFTSVSSRMGIKVTSKKVMCIDWTDEKLRPCVEITVVDRTNYKPPNKRGRPKNLK